MKSEFGSLVGIERVLLIVLPDSWDMEYWLKLCNELSQRTQFFFEPISPIDGARLPADLAYPQCVIRKEVASDDFVDPVLVYVGWKGKIRFRHRVSRISPLEEKAARSMNPNLKSLMKFGHNYVWCQAEYEKVVEVDLPKSSLQDYDRVVGLQNGAEIKWTLSQKLWKRVPAL